jgi:hypothetical protein
MPSSTNNTFAISPSGITGLSTLTIDNLFATKIGTNINLLQNPGFEMPRVTSVSEARNVPGWSGFSITLGQGPILHPEWDSQVLVVKTGVVS